MGKVEIYRRGDWIEILSKAVREKRVVVIMASMEVRYKGRSSSKLSPGERICIIKPDGAVLIHRPFGYEPVNWQPSGSLITFGAKDDKIYMKVIRRKPHEILTVYFDKISTVIIADLVDKGVFSMIGDEEDMRKAIILKPELVEEGLKIIKFEKRLPPGFVDLYALDSEGRLVIIELKKDVAGLDAVIQLKRYVDYIRRDVPNARGILVSPKLAKNCLEALRGYGLEYKRLSLEKCLKVLEEEKGLTKFL